TPSTLSTSTLSTIAPLALLAPTRGASRRARRPRRAVPGARRPLRAPPLRLRRVHAEQRPPAVRRVDRRPNRRRVHPVALEMPMLEIDARAARDGGEADLHFARLRQVRLELPLSRDLP